MQSEARPVFGRFYARALAACLVGACLLMTGCGALITQQAELKREAEIRREAELKRAGGTVGDEFAVVESAPKRQRVETLANKFALMALFAKVTYRKDIADHLRDATACDYLKPGAKMDTFGMPFTADVDGNYRSGWKRWTDPIGAPPCFSRGGLDYETYVHQAANGKYDEAVIAFRGTENEVLREQFRDWSTNFSAAVGFEPSQYKLAQTVVPRLIEQLLLAAPDIRIYATGHSLGGGLAQQAAYMSRGIAETFAFDSTPVTNWSFLMLHDDEARAALLPAVIQNQDPVIHRVYHRNEFLSYLRYVSSKFNTRRFGRSDYEFFFEEGSLVGAHEMGILACNLAKLIQGDAAEHDYPKAYAQQKVLNRDYPVKGQKVHPICSQGGPILN